MDTIPRPSSTYNNLCALRAYRAADFLGLKTAPTHLTEATRNLLHDRWTGTHLRDHAAALGDYLSADGNVPALYFDVLPEWVRRRIAYRIEQSTLCDPVPMRTREGDYLPEELPIITRLAPSYHNTIWLHLGLMYLNGLKRIGAPYEHHLRHVDKVVLRNGNFLETLDSDGTPHRGRFLATEHGFTMSAGQYLELVGGEREGPDAKP
jgi:hypothetical protein